VVRKKRCEKRVHSGRAEVL